MTFGLLGGGGLIGGAGLIAGGGLMGGGAITLGGGASFSGGLSATLGGTAGLTGMSGSLMDVPNIITNTSNFNYINAPLPVPTPVSAPSTIVNNVYTTNQVTNGVPYPTASTWDAASYYQPAYNYQSTPAGTTMTTTTTTMGATPHVSNVQSYTPSAYNPGYARSYTQTSSSHSIHSHYGTYSTDFGMSAPMVDPTHNMFQTNPFF